MTKELPLSKLMIETAFLVAVVCFKRPADLCNVQVVENYWELDINGFTCQPLGYGKTESHNPIPPIRIEPFHQDPILCPVYHLVFSSTICGWLKEVITASGSMAAMARDVRSAGASTAMKARLDIRQVMWSWLLGTGQDFPLCRSTISSHSP